MYDIVTIACPKGFTDPFVDLATAPIWVDTIGTEYLVATGVPGSGTYVPTDPIVAQPDRVNIVIGVEGLSALAAMGLSPKIYN